MRSLLALLVLLSATGCSDSADDAPPVAPEVPADAPVVDTGLDLRLPPALDDLPRRSLDTSIDAAMGASVTNVTARYGAVAGSGEPSVEVYVSQYPDAGMAEMMGLGWATRDVDNGTSGSEMRPTESFEGDPARRTWDASARKGRLQVVADQTLLVEVRAEGVTEEVMDSAARAALTEAQ